MLVPLTDSSNPYSAMMLELIADQKRYPQSAYPRRELRTTIRSGGRRRARLAALAAAAGLVALAAASVATRIF